MGIELAPIRWRTSTTTRTTVVASDLESFDKDVSVHTAHHHHTTTPHHSRLGGFRDQNLENRNEGLAWPGYNIYLIFFSIEILKYCWLDVSWCLEAVLCLATGCALPLRDLLTASLELYNISLFPEICQGGQG